MLQAFQASLQSPDLALCRKDVNALLGEMDPDAAELDYQSIVPEVYELLSARMVVSPRPQAAAVTFGQLVHNTRSR